MPAISIARRPSTRHRTASPAARLPGVLFRARRHRVHALAPQRRYERRSLHGAHCPAARPARRPGGPDRGHQRAPRGARRARAIRTCSACSPARPSPRTTRSPSGWRRAARRATSWSRAAASRARKRRSFTACTRRRNGRAQPEAATLRPASRFGVRRRFKRFVARRYRGVRNVRTAKGFLDDNAAQGRSAAQAQRAAPAWQGACPRPGPYRRRCGGPQVTPAPFARRCRRRSSLDAGKTRRIDTACLQLLLAFVRDRRPRARPWPGARHA